MASFEKERVYEILSSKSKNKDITLLKAIISLKSINLNDVELKKNLKQK